MDVSIFKVGNKQNKLLEIRISSLSAKQKWFKNINEMFDICRLWINTYIINKYYLNKSVDWNSL